MKDTVEKASAQIGLRVNQECSITFPITVEEFVAYQIAIIGRGLFFWENELLGLSVKILNDCYNSGKAGEPLPWAESLEDTIDFFADCGRLDLLQNPTFKQYFSAMLFWTKRAYAQGKGETT